MAGASAELPGKEQVICSGLRSGRIDVLQTPPDIVLDLAIKVAISVFCSSSHLKAVVKLH